MSVKRRMRTAVAVPRAADFLPARNAATEAATRPRAIRDGTTSRREIGNAANAGATGPVPESDSRAKARSCAEWKRCAGSFSRQRRTIRSRAGGAIPCAELSSGGSSFRIAANVAAVVSARNARRPDSIS